MSKKIKDINDCTNGNEFIHYLHNQGKEHEPKGKWEEFQGKRGKARIENSSVPMSKPERNFLIKLLKAVGVIAVALVFVVGPIVAVLYTLLRPYFGG